MNNICSPNLIKLVKEKTTFNTAHQINHGLIEEWLLVNHSIKLDVYSDNFNGNKKEYTFIIYKLAEEQFNRKTIVSSELYNSFNDATDSALQYALKNLVN